MALNSQQKPSRAAPLLVSQTTATLLYYANDIMIKKHHVSVMETIAEWKPFLVWLAPCKEGVEGGVLEVIGQQCTMCAVLRGKVHAVHQ